MQRTDFEGSTNQELDKYVKDATHRPVGEGSYNFVTRLFKSASTTETARPWVIKWPLFFDNSSDDKINDTKRAYRKFRAINPDEPIYAIDGYRMHITGMDTIDDSDVQPGVLYISYENNALKSVALNSSGHLEKCIIDKTTTDYQRIARAVKRERSLTQDQINIIFKKLNYPRSGLLIPCYDGPAAMDTEIANAVIDIYLRTRNIILDACGTRNFVVHDGRAICIDVDAAYNRSSETSIDSFTLFHKDNLICTEIGEQFTRYWASHSLKPKTISTIKTLLYLESKFSVAEIEDKYITADFLGIICNLIKLKYSITHKTLELIYILLTSDIKHEIKITTLLLTELSRFDIEDTISINAFLEEQKSKRVDDAIRPGSEVASVAACEPLATAKRELDTKDSESSNKSIKF